MLYAVAGIILITVGLCLLISEYFQRLRCSKSVTGKIAYIETRSEVAGRGVIINYYYPVYEYEIDGHIYHGRPRQYSKYENWYQIGDTSTLSYNPRNPEEIVVKKFMGELIGACVFSIVGIILLIIYYIR